MRKAICSTAAAVIVLLSGAGVLLEGPRAQAADGRVVMSDSDSDAMKWRFEPADLTVAAGSTVVWHNGGNQAHTVTADDGKSFSSPNMPTGGEFQFKFATPGDFAYHCEPHPWMKAIVHVTGASAPTTAPPATSTTQPGSRSAAADSSTTTTTAKAGQSSTTSTTSTTAAAQGATSTTAGPATTTTTIASSATPTSAPDSAASTTTTAPTGGEAASGTSKGGSHDGKSSPLGIAFAAVATLLLTGVSAKLLASKA